MRTIAAVTVGRSDYGIYTPVLRAIQARRGLRLRLVVAGAHLSPRGMGARRIARDGFPVAAKVPTMPGGDGALDTARAMGRATAAFADAFARLAPDLLLVLGDRYEMHSAAVAALPLNLPVAHLHGGELTEGAFDDSLRHSITKLSHLHFVAADEYARRVRQLGEESWRITVCGAPGLDNLTALAAVSDARLKALTGLDVSRPFIVATYHPVTREPGAAGRQVDELLAGLRASPHPVLFTAPNADPESGVIRRRLRAARVSVVEELGSPAYFALMSRAAAMVGNSSSGLIEAPSVGLPVVNVGPRQDGRIRARNVIDVACSRRAVAAGLRRALSPEFRRSLRGLRNPNGSGRAAPRIAEVLSRVKLGPGLLVKRFADA